MFGDFLPEASSLTFAMMILCILAVCIFEFVNGFHDTANAVATVIYTHTLKPMQAVVWSGFWNFLGVWMGGIAVAMSIINLLPLNELLDQSLNENIALVMAILVTAISWNLLTWYLGIPCSSSHTLIGALLGAGLGFWLTNGGAGVNWAKAYDIGAALLLSPAFGFTVVIILMFLAKHFLKNKEIFKEPEPNKPPPMWIRAILITTCTLVSFFHGSNDGQKGVGMLMVILLAFAPAHFALNPKIDLEKVDFVLEEVKQILIKHSDVHFFSEELLAKKGVIEAIQNDLRQLGHDDAKEKIAVRKRVQLLRKNLTILLDDPIVFQQAEDRKKLTSALETMTTFTDFAPLWAILLISISLGLGTMIGWKRIVVTIGEKIGKTHLTYAQGAAAEIVAAATIGMSTGLGLPVSTTHVLSSGVAGSMVASNGTKNLQKGTIMNIGLAWILTLPVTILGSMFLFWLFQLFA